MRTPAPWRRSDLVSAAVGYVELRSAAGKAVRDGRVREEDRERVMLTLERLWEEVSEVALDRPLLRQAGELAERMRLRAYDAVHLAALRHTGKPPDMVFACWDAELRRAARALGYLLLPA